MAIPPAPVPLGSADPHRPHRSCRRRGHQPGRHPARFRQRLADLDVPWKAGTLVLGVAFSPDGKLLAATCPDRTVKLWRCEPGQEGKGYTLVGSLPSHTLTLAQVAFSPDGTRLAAGSWDGNVKVWDLDKRRARSREHTAF